jgi:hypothetical protein
MERKKALVEVDEGPFAKVVSVAELNERRRVISGETEAGDRDRNQKEEDGKEKGHRLCGMGVACTVM